MEKLKKRITFTLPDDKLELLEQLAVSTDKAPGAVAKDIIMETLGSMQEMFKDTATNDQAMRKMFKLAMVKMIDAIDETGDS
jgi:hypothetical protein